MIYMLKCPCGLLYFGQTKQTLRLMIPAQKAGIEAWISNGMSLWECTLWIGLLTNKSILCFMIGLRCFPKCLIVSILFLSYIFIFSVVLADVSNTQILPTLWETAVNIWNFFYHHYLRLLCWGYLTITMCSRSHLSRSWAIEVMV